MLVKLTFNVLEFPEHKTVGVAVIVVLAIPGFTTTPNVKELLEQPVVVFSDSPEWVKEQEFFSGDRFLISEPQDKYADGSFTPYADLCLMSLCSHALIANSSLSWWGAWLINNPNKKVIAPKMWFGPAYSDKDTKDLYCPDWIVL